MKQIRVLRDSTGKPLTYDDGHYVKVCPEHGIEYALAAPIQFAEIIVAAVNAHDQLVAACKEVREACAIQIDGLQALMAITQPAKPTATTIIDVVRGLEISEAKLLNALEAAKGGDPTK